MNPRKRRLLKLKALEAKKAAAAPIPEPVVEVAAEPVIAAEPVAEPVVEAAPEPVAEEPAAKPVRKRRTRKTATKKEE